MSHKFPVAVLISDIHYNINTLEVADSALNRAVGIANELDVPLIIAGDLHDTKANIRGECADAILRTIQKAKRMPYILRGNHDSLNEKSSKHSLSFLREFSFLIEEPKIYSGVGRVFYTIVFIPYCHDTTQIQDFLSKLSDSRTIVMHQGITGANTGHYIQDKSAIPKEWLREHRVISGHYHTRQTVELGKVKENSIGLFDYIGNPYTLTFGEVNDPDKGIQILYDDNSLEFMDLGLRKHQIIDINACDEAIAVNIPEDSILWVKVRGTAQELSKFNKQSVKTLFSIKQPFKLDLIKTESTFSLPSKAENITAPNLFDSIIDTNISDAETKTRLTAYWKQFLY